MDYKEKYNAALERMKSWAKGEHPECFSEAQKAAEFIFPELKESEDEKIRKEIIAIFKGKIPYTSEEDAKRYIDWLEKQKEFVSADFDDVWETADCDELTAPLEKYSKDAIKEMCHAWYDKGIELERRNRDRIEISFDAKDNELQEVTYYIPKGFHAEMGDDKVVIKKGKKSTAWSDEDERIRKWIIDDIRYNMNNEPLNNSEYKKKAEKAIAWLEKQGT